MKLSKTTKEINRGEFTAVLKKLSAFEKMTIQKKAIKFKDSAAGAEINKSNIFQHIETDQTALRLGQVLHSLVSWNLEAEDSTNDNPKYLPITEETLKNADFPNELFLFIENEVNELNNPSAKETKN